MVGEQREMVIALENISDHHPISESTSTNTKAHLHIAKHEFENTARPVAEAAEQKSGAFIVLDGERLNARARTPRRRAQQQKQNKKEAAIHERADRERNGGLENLWLVDEPNARVAVSVEE